MRLSCHSAITPEPSGFGRIVNRSTERITHTAYVDGLPIPDLRWDDRGRYHVGSAAIRFESEWIQDHRFDATRRNGRLETLRDIVGEGQPALYRCEKGVIAF